MTDIERVTTLPHLPKRPSDAHKGTFGRVLIVAGSPGMSGAAALCGLGALRGGAGLVYVATSRAVVPTVASIEPSYLTLLLSDDADGQLRASAQTEILTALAEKDAAAIGPGLGTSAKVQKIVAAVYQQAKVPLVVDADGLNCLAMNKSALTKPKGPRILTPHPGEFARLLGVEIKAIQANREKFAAEFAAKHKVVLVLKGSGTVVTDGRRVYTNVTGNSGMATGGTGDVLTGLITALLAQKLAAFAAAQLAVYLHGLAGDLAAEELTQPGMIASDVVRFLPYAWKRFLNG